MLIVARVVGSALLIFISSAFSVLCSASAIAQVKAIPATRLAPLTGAARQVQGLLQQAPSTTASAVPADEQIEADATNSDPDFLAAENSLRLQQLQSMEFDRRPSAILRAWSEAAQIPADNSSQLEGNENGEDSDKSDLSGLIRHLQSAVTRGNWMEVAALLDKLPETERLSAWNQILSSLLQGPKNSTRARNNQVIGERNILRASDLIALAEISPQRPLDEAAASRLGALSTTCSNEGEAPGELVRLLSLHIQDPPDNALLNQTIAVRILNAAGRHEDAAQFLPTAPSEGESWDAEMLLLIATIRHSVWQNSRDPQELRQAWDATLAALDATAVPADSPGTADSDTTAKTNTTADSESEQTGILVLQMAVRLAPLLEGQLGRNWLDDSFRSELQRGRRIMQGIGQAAAGSMATMVNDVDGRVGILQLQQTAVDALLDQADAEPEEWREALNLMLINWLREARYSQQHDTSAQRGPQLQRDNFGNYYYQQESSAMLNQARMQSGLPDPIPAGRLLDILPEARWLKYLDPAVFPTFASTIAELYLKVQQEDEAFPWIERVADSHPDEAVKLVQNFLQTWAANHDPNSNRRRTGVYMFSFGFNQRLNAIPLTRSHQQRNLAELARWVSRIRSLQLEGIEQSWIATAFTGIHSSAEVYQLEDLQTVFGDAQGIEPQALSILLTQMRSNLATIWRSPQVQQNSQTNRRKQEIEAEVVRGYDSAIALCTTALGQHPENWQLIMQQGALQHDQANYRNDLARSSEFLDQRKQALSTLQDAAQAYISAIGELDASEYSVEAFNTWFYASLGDADVRQITPERNPLSDQFQIIAGKLEQLPETSRDQHKQMFANDLFARMSGVNPAVKYRYIREGLGLVGDQSQALEATKVHEYYSDLVSEISLQAQIDGPLHVGSQMPFGVLVSIRHTRAIEREAGGFSRYLQNQNSGGGYFYNNGRPNEDYRDKFEDAARQALDEHFEVLSVTFEPESVQSIPEAEPGWRTTPYAWILLKARGPEIDRLPSLRLDLDFLDTTGYVVLPVETTPLAIDCSGDESLPPRPFENLVVTQTLDERMFNEGRLLLEVKATAIGLVPELDSILDVSFAGFDVASVDDGILSVSSFDDSSQQPRVLSERIWNLTLERNDQQPPADGSFLFASAGIEDVELLYQRFNDADLVTVEQKITLISAATGSTGSGSRFQTLTAVLMLITLAASGVIFVRTKKASTLSSAAQNLRVLPETLDAFSAIGLLRGLLDESEHPDQRVQIEQAMQLIESQWFASGRQKEPQDLKIILEPWFTS